MFVLGHSKRKGMVLTHINVPHRLYFVCYVAWKSVHVFFNTPKQLNIDYYFCDMKTKIKKISYMYTKEELWWQS